MSKRLGVVSSLDTVNVPNMNAPLWVVLTGQNH